MKNTCDTVLGAMLGGRQLGLAFAITSICSLESGSALLSLAQSGHRATHCTIVDPKVNVEQRLFWLDRFMSDSNCGGSRGDERDRSSLTLEKTMEGMVAAVKEAGDAALALQSAGLSRKTKQGHHDIVTEGDIASQRIAMGGLAKVFPGVQFAAEEPDAEALVPGVPLARIRSDGSISSEAYLALDPVDGTTNFACGGPDWGVAAAVVRRDVGPTHGVLYLPRKGIVVEASKGHGCKINGDVVNLRKGQCMKECLVAAEMGAFIPDHRLQRLLALVHHSMGIRNLFSSTGNTADILSGVHGAWIHLEGGSVWDFAAGALAIQEAGGFACDLQGQPLRWDNLKMEVILAANEEIARDVVRVLGIEK